MNLYVEFKSNPHLIWKLIDVKIEGNDIYTSEYTTFNTSTQQWEDKTTTGGYFRCHNITKASTNPEDLGIPESTWEFKVLRGGGVVSRLSEFGDIIEVKAISYEGAFELALNKALQKGPITCIALWCGSHPT